MGRREAAPDLRPDDELTWELIGGVRKSPEAYRPDAVEQTRLIARMVMPPV